MISTGEIIRLYIKGKFKRDEIATLLDISPQYFSNILGNKKSPSKDLLNKIIKILEISEDDVEKIYDYEKSKKGIKKTNFKAYKYIDKKMSILSNTQFLSNLFNEEYKYVVLSKDFFEYKANDILVFKKYTDENLDKKYIINNNNIYYIRLANKKYIVESDEIKIIKDIDVEYILIYSIRR